MSANYLSHGQALEYVLREAGLSRETFDLSIRPRLVERQYSERVSRFSRLAIDEAIKDPSFTEGAAMLLRRRTVADALEHTWDTTWCLQKGSKAQRSLVDQVKRETGSWALKRVDYNRLEGWVLELRKRGLAEATIARRLTCLMKALRVAKVKGWLGSVPEKPPVSISNERDRYLTHAEEAALRDAAAALGGVRGRILMLVMPVLADTGCRLSELMKVRPHDLSDDGVIFRNRKGGDKLKVPLSARARQAIGELHRDEWWQHWTAKVHGNGDDAKTALKTLKDRLTSDFRRIRATAKVPDVTLHTFRHTCASRLVAGGLDLLKVKAWLGHKDVKVTQRYAHLAPSSLKAGLALLESREGDNVVDFEKRRILDE